MTRAHLDKNPRDVAAMFDGVAKRYDITNDVLSMGQDRWWRHATVQAIDPQPGMRILDLAAGTATSTAPLLDAGALTVAADFSLGMLRVAHQQWPMTPLVAADAVQLPFADNTFDAVTISFGIRNVARRELALADLLRVTKPGGRLVICEFSTPTFAPWRVVYLKYLMKALPAIARTVSSNPESYVYLAESIQSWPNQEQFAAEITAAGWSDVAFRNLSGGVVALHRATKG